MLEITMLILNMRGRVQGTGSSLLFAGAFKYLPRLPRLHQEVRRTVRRIFIRTLNCAEVVMSFYYKVSSMEKLIIRSFAFCAVCSAPELKNIQVKSSRIMILINSMTFWVTMIVIIYYSIN